LVEEVAADLAGALRAERQRKQPVVIVRSFLHCLQHDAGFDRDRIAGRVDLADAVQPLVDRMIALPLMSGICPPTSPVLPPCGTTGVLRFEASFRIGGDLLRRAGPDHGGGLAGPAFAPLLPGKARYRRRR
jgi:hypothetical protein